MEQQQNGFFFVRKESILFSEAEVMLFKYLFVYV
jgi:hypothetical protein